MLLHHGVGSSGDSQVSQTIDESLQQAAPTTFRFATNVIGATQSFTLRLAGSDGWRPALVRVTHIQDGVMQETRSFTNTMSWVLDDNGSIRITGQTVMCTGRLKSGVCKL